MKPLVQSNHIKIQDQLEQMRKQVGFDSYDLALRQLLDMFETGDIFIPEEYQRQFVWDEKRESMLIESAFLGIPIPSLFMATNRDSTWEIVDGVQRICTFAHYAGDEKLLQLINKSEPLVLGKLEKLKSMNDTSFHSIQKSIQLKILNCPIRVTVLNDKSDLEVRFDLFERLNTGGVLLTDQEIRNCVFRGDFTTQIKELAKDPNFNKSIHLKPVDRNNGTKEELVLRYFAFIDRYHLFEHSVKDFLNGYIKDNYNKPASKTTMALFEETFRFISQELPGGIIRGNRKITPVNLYEAVAVGTALAISSGKRVKRNLLKNIVNDQALKKYTTGATNTPRMVTNRIEFVRDCLV